jgi:hypothetical protein
MQAIMLSDVSLTVTAFFFSFHAMKSKIKEDEPSDSVSLSILEDDDVISQLHSSR